MTYLEIDRAMIDIVEKKAQECKNRLTLIPKENTVEQKALKVEHGMYCLCNNAGTVYHNQSEAQRKAILNMRKRIILKNQKAYEVFNQLNEEEQLCFIASLQAEIFIRENMYKKYLDEFDQAVAHQDPNSTFELKIKIGALQNVFSDWEAWRIENNVYPHILEGVPL